MQFLHHRPTNASLLLCILLLEALLSPCLHNSSATLPAALVSAHGLTSYRFDQQSCLSMPDISNPSIPVLNFPSSSFSVHVNGDDPTGIPTVFCKLVSTAGIDASQLSLPVNMNEHMLPS